ncbi:MAG: glycosyltransferase [Deltaproteobacteria bacterium]|nr:glycosyltransferase [Deltaproteobacteria bacterium]
MSKGRIPGEPPLVSVVVTTYNRAGMLKETVSSILSQTCQGFELIIVDNMSTDGTEEYVRSIADGRLGYLRNANNGIIAVNRNAGIGRARGKYVAFCDDDDLWLPDKLKLQTSFMEANPAVGLCFGFAEDFGQTPSAGQLRFPADECMNTRGYDDLLSGNRIATLTVMVTKACLDDTGLFDEDPALRTVEDYDLWLRIARRFRIACIPEKLGRYRIHARSASSDEAAEKKKLFHVLEKFKKNGWLNEAQARGMEANVNWMVGNALIAVGDPSYREWHMRSFAIEKRAKTVLAALLCVPPTSIARRIFRFLKKRKDRGKLAKG